MKKQTDWSKYSPTIGIIGTIAFTLVLMATGAGQKHKEKEESK